MCGKLQLGDTELLPVCALVKLRAAPTMTGRVGERVAVSDLNPFFRGKP